MSEVIAIDKSLHVKLFLFSSPIPLPPWFKSNGCKLKSKSMLDNFPTYIKNYKESNGTTYNILDELQNIRYKKPVDQPKYSTSLLQFALILRYTSSQAYSIILKKFPFPSFSLLKGLSHGDIAPLKALKLLLEQKKIDKDIVLLLDEMYLQKSVQYHSGKLVGSDEEGNLYKGILTFLIVGLRKNIPFVVKAVPECKLEAKFITMHIETTLKLLAEIGFRVRAVIMQVMLQHLKICMRNMKTVPTLVQLFVQKQKRLYIYFMTRYIY